MHSTMKGLKGYSLPKTVVVPFVSWNRENSFEAMDKETVSVKILVFRLCVMLKECIQQ